MDKSANRYRSIAAGLCGALLLVAPSLEANTRLAPSADGHYLVWGETSEPFLWIGDLNYQGGQNLFYELTVDVAIQYVEARHAEGYSAIQVRIANGPNNDINRDDQPSRLETGALNPSFHDRIIPIIARARELQLALAFRIGVGGSEIDAPTRQLCRGLGDRYGVEPHVVFVINHDFRNNETGRETVRACAEELIQGHLGQALSWDQPSTTWGRLALTINAHQPSSSAFFHDDPWLMFNGHETWDNRTGVYDDALADYELSPPKPTINAESRVYGFSEPLDTRRMLWQNRLAGSFATFWTNTQNAAEHRAAVTHLGSFWRARQWWHFVPSPDLIAGAPGEGSERIVAARSGSHAVVYYPSNRSIALNLDELGPTGGISAGWYDPASGALAPGLELPATGSATLQPPQGFEDAVLELTAGPTAGTGGTSGSGGLAGAPATGGAGGAAAAGGASSGGSPASGAGGQGSNWAGGAGGSSAIAGALQQPNSGGTSVGGNGLMSGGATAPASDDRSGCGCRLASERPASKGLVAFALAAAALSRRRRRRISSVPFSPP